MQFVTIAGYKFISLTDLNRLRDSLLSCCQKEKLLGTILLSHEGININLSGHHASITEFYHAFKKHNAFADIQFRISYSNIQPFKRLKIKLKKEIITFRTPLKSESYRAPSITPQQLKQWLDEKRDLTLLDVRNAFEINYGTFKNATQLNLDHFSHFKKASGTLTDEKPIVMFCTGGIRCEKAALHLIEQGFSQVYQLEGGILNYFSEVGNAHYQGDCFVFDDRESIHSVNTRLIDSFQPSHSISR